MKEEPPVIYAGECQCVTPEETEQSHRILTAALDSNRQAQVVQLNSESEQWKQ